MLGLNTFIKQEIDNRFIFITKDMTGDKKRFQLEPDSTTYQQAIVCRRTSYFYARILGIEYPQHVIKFL